MLDLLASQRTPVGRHSRVGRALAGEEFTVVEEFGDPARDRRTYEIRFDTLRDRTESSRRYQFSMPDRRVRDTSRLSGRRSPPQAQKWNQSGSLRAAWPTTSQPRGLRERSAAARAQREPGQRRRVYTGCGEPRSRPRTDSPLLAFSRRRPVNPESIDLAASLKRNARDARRSLRGDIHVEMRFGPDLWPWR